MSKKLCLRERVERDLSYIFEPIFSDEDDTLAYFCPVEGFGTGTLVFKMDVWCNHSYQKYVELKRFFKKHKLPFVPFERFVILSLARTFDHETIHSVELLGTSEDEMSYIVNKLFTERLLDEIIIDVRNQLKARFSRVKREEFLSTMRNGLESMLRQTSKTRKNSRKR